VSSLIFDGKKIVLAISGGIAAYKSCELLRELRRKGASVRVMMTSGSREFISPLTFAALSEHPVLTDAFALSENAEIEHIKWSRWADAIVVCPATANTIARIANGFADEPVSATIRAARVPIVICPAMNSAMWEDRLVQRNVALLHEADYHIVEPEHGALATSSEGEGWGRLARLEWILSALLAALQNEQPLKGKKILITAGRTEEYFDPVRMLTNPSTGKMGFALSEAAVALGAEKVVLVHGPTTLPAPYKVQMAPVVSAADMYRVALQHYEGTDILVMSAAVSDYRPAAVSSEKIKKLPGLLKMELEPTEDILHGLGQRKTKAIHVGFALETFDEIENARAKLRRKNLDFIVVNNPRDAGAGFGTDTNQVAILDAKGNVETLPLLSKAEVGFQIFKRVFNQHD